MSSIDIFRLALTGGARLDGHDTATETVLWRINLAQVAADNHCYNIPRFVVHPTNPQFRQFGAYTPSKCTTPNPPPLVTAYNTATINPASVTPIAEPFEVSNVSDYVQFLRLDGTPIASSGVTRFRVAVKVCVPPQLESQCVKHVGAGGLTGVCYSAGGAICRLVTSRNRHHRGS